MNTTSIVKKTATKKTEKKEYLFNEDVWRIIMRFVGTPQDFIDRKMNIMIEARVNRFILYKDCRFIPYSYPIYDIPTPILMTLDEYNFEGFKHKQDLYTEIYDYAFNRCRDADDLKFNILRLYGNNTPANSKGKIVGDNILKGKRILKVLVKTELICGLNPSQISNSLLNFHMILGGEYDGGNPLMGTQYLVVVSNTKK
jgi:hypothetical protein